MFSIFSGLHLADGNDVSPGKTVYQSSEMGGFNVQALVDNMPGKTL